MDSAEQKVEEQEKLETLQPPAQDGDEIEDDKSGREAGNQEGEELSLRDEQSGALQRLEEERPSEVETAGPEDACKEKSQTGVVHPLSLTWSFGFNSSLPVHNVSEGNRKMIFYVSSHTGILYDCTANKQCLLQGHSNPITCSAVSGDKRWLVTADIGTDCMLIVWDSYSAIPVRTLFNGLGQGCVAVAMSHDAQYVATVSMAVPQVVCVWDWTSGSDDPLCKTTLNTDFRQQTFLVFNKEDSSQLVSNGENTVVFYSWHGSELKASSTPVSDKDFNKPVGLLSQSVFIPGSTRALTGTSEGCGVVWEVSRLAVQGVLCTDPHVKKLMKIHDSPITIATTVEGLVVTGDSGGQVRFLDSDLKLLHWYEHTPKLGPLASVSFAYAPKLDMMKMQKESEQEGHHYPADSTMGAPPFIIPDFSISTHTATIAHITTNGSTTDVLFRESDAAVHALAAHPSEPRLLVGSYSCKLKLWDYINKEGLAVRDFGEPNYIQCVTFDSKGEFVGVGFTSGVVSVLDALTLEDVCQPFHYARDCITHIAFSHDSSYMATADLDLCVTVYVAQSGEETQQPWQFLAKHKAHYKQIQSLLFGVMLDTRAPQLLSVARDRTLVEYDLQLAHSGEDDLQLLSVDRIEQSAVPTALSWYPPLSKESFLLLANDQFKLKLYNSTTKMCRKTLLGPTFGGPLRRLCVLPAPIIHSDSGEEKRRYLAYITTDKLGLLLLPHDGSPHNSMCLTAHPGLVTEMACSHDGKYIFTAGGEDCTINMWTVNTDALEATSLLGGTGLSPFYAMLEGGREGGFFAELEDYFYYAQIRSQGPDSMNTREVSTTVPIGQIPYIMRAIGFYPSEQEIEDMLNEVKFSKYVDTGTYVKEIDLGDFIKLYVNHRPAFGLSPAQLTRAFRVLGQQEEEGEEGRKEWAVDRGTLLALLQEKGEHITESELVEHLMTLLGCCEDPETDGAFSQDPEATLQELPEKITAGQFAEELLGLSTQ